MSILGSSPVVNAVWPNSPTRQRSPVPPINPLGPPAAGAVPALPQVPVGQVPTSPQPGGAGYWDFLRNLFSGQQLPAGGQGMRGLMGPQSQRL